MLFSFAEKKIMDKKYRLREKQIDRINFKLLSDDKFRVKNDIIEFQIESQLKQLQPNNFTSNNIDYKRNEELTQLRRKLMKEKLKMDLKNLNTEELKR